MLPISNQSKSRRRDVELAGGSTQLCDRCETIDIKPLLDQQLEVPLQGLHVLPLGKPRSKDFQKPCPLCQLFLSVATKYKRNYSLELRLFDNIPTPEYRQKGKSLKDRARIIWIPNVHNSNDVDQRFLAVIRQNKRLVYDHSVAHEIGSRGLLPISRTFNHACSIHVIDPAVIRYESLTSWLQNCAASHGRSCNQGNENSPSLQLYAIDCLDNTVVALGQNEKYVALSYVWGTTADATRFSTSAADDDRATASLPPDVPLVIADAMQVVKNIGQRYLWVDKYCIPQTNISFRREAISNMNQIYARAEVTIVALYGNDSRAGLPGVSSIPRSGLQQVSTQESQIISTFPPLATVIGQSTWATRGWTYQEARLSRRCLFFTEYQVYFACHEKTLSEALSDGPLTSSVSRHLNSKGLDPLTFSTSQNSIPSGLFLDRLTFSQRTLSHQEDALDAFRGILRLHPFVTLWGVPVTRKGWALDPCVGFALGLLWMRRPPWSLNRHVINNVGDSYGRRSGFPTWSWTSVVGEIFQDVFGSQSFYEKFLQEGSHFPDGQMENIRPSLKVEMPTSGVSLSETIELTETNILSETSTSILIEGDIVRVMRRMENGEAFWFCQQEDKPIMDHIIFAHYDIDGVDGEESGSTERKFEPRDALILIDWNDDQRQSETRFVLMLLRWVGNGIAERVGLLGQYRERWDNRFVKTLPRRRQKFELR